MLTEEDGYDGKSLSELSLSIHGAFLQADIFRFPTPLFQSYPATGNSHRYLGESTKSETVIEEGSERVKNGLEAGRKGENEYEGGLYHIAEK